MSNERAQGLLLDRLINSPLQHASQSVFKDMTSYEALCKEAQKEPELFWSRLAQEHLQWDHPFSHVLDKSHAPFYRWFDDGALNASVNCLDRHLGTECEHKVAIHFETVDGKVTSVTYRTLYERVCQLANALKERGVEKGDRVLIYLPMGDEGVVAMLACARIGAIHVVVFAGFSAIALHERLQDTGAVAVITANVQCRSGRELPLKAGVDDAIALGGCEHVGTILVYERTATAWPRQEGRDFSYAELVSQQPTECAPVSVSAEHPLFILYTSGSTGKPKGVVHTTAGYLLWAKLTMLWSYDIQPSDVFWCTADIGWITGHTYVTYGPLATGATQVIMEGVPLYPDASRVWKTIQRHAVTIFYTAPTLIRALIKAAAQEDAYAPESYDVSSLRILSSVGEPIDATAWRWFYEHVGHGRCPYVDTFFQTETGGHVITPIPGVTPLVPGSCTLPLPGMDVVIVDEAGEPRPWGQGGLLVIASPWPAMARTLWRDDERYRQSYFPEELGGTLYLAGDGAVRDEDTGYFRITGRIDDVLNVSGHRLGTTEIESALSRLDHAVAEVAVVGQPDPSTGEAVCAFVVLKKSDYGEEVARQIAQELRQQVARDISPIAKPKFIRFGPNLPKTRSGKVMRRLLRSFAQGEKETQDISTLEDPAVLDHFSVIY